METINLDKQLIPYLEPVINQTLDMVESISKEEGFNRQEVKTLLNQLEEEFGEYTHLLSPQIKGRILEINHFILGDDKVYEITDEQQNTQPLDNNAKE
jgi:hypothetical protein